jgi:hypothetical protein
MIRRPPSAVHNGDLAIKTKCYSIAKWDRLFNILQPLRHDSGPVISRKSPETRGQASASGGHPMASQRSAPFILQLPGMRRNIPLAGGKAGRLNYGGLSGLNVMLMGLGLERR